MPRRHPRRDRNGWTILRATRSAGKLIEVIAIGFIVVLLFPWWWA